MGTQSKIVALAQQRGSTANTHNGAMRWLRAHLGKPLPGIVATTEDAPLTVRCDVCGAEPWQPCLAKQWTPLPQGETFHAKRKPVHAKHDLSEARKYVFVRRGERAMRRFGLIAKDEAEKWAHELTAKLMPRPDYPYRTSDSPASFTFHVALGEPHMSVNTENEWGCYSKRCKYPALAQHVTLTVRLRTLCLFPSLTVTAGDGKARLVIDAEQLPDGESYRLVWGEQTRGLSVREAKGYLIGNQLIESDSLEAARALWKRRIVKRVSERLGVTRKTA